VIRRSAPGKLYIAGEYAVVEPGHQALLVAVDRFITVRVTPAEHTGRITSALYETRYLTWYRSPDGTVVVERQANDYVVSAIRHVEQVVREGGGELRFFDLDVHSELAEPDGRKLGLGSSAAVTVATVRAVAGFYDLPLFNTAMMESLGKGAPWALAKAPFGKNGIASAGEPHDFLSEAQKPYASTLVDIQYGDEKQWDNTEGDYYQKWFEWSKTAYPGALVHSNQYDDYTWRRPQVLDYYVRAVKPDLLSWDTYYYSTTSGPGPDRVVTSLLNNQTWQAQREYALKGLTGDGARPPP